MQISIPRFQIIREAPEPLGLFFRPGRADHTTINQLVSENRTGMAGVVFDLCHLAFQESLRSDLWARDLYTVLDPLVMELATAGGLTTKRIKLPWAGEWPQIPSDFNSKKVDTMAGLIAECVAKNKFNAVLTPSHYLQAGVNDPWLLIDRRLTTQLRRELDAAGCKDVSLYYPLATSTTMLFDRTQRRGLKAILSSLPIDGVWLRIHPFGSQCGDTVLRRHIAACQDLHGMKMPLVAEKTGALGLALLAFGAVSAIESGVGSGEQFNFGRLKSVRKKRPIFSARPRVYIASLGTFLPRKEAVEFLKDLKLRQFACRDTDCCHQGYESMTKDPRRHFAYTKMEEVGLLSGTPERLRPEGYLQRIIRPADDNLGRVLGAAKLSAPIKHALEIRRRRVHGWNLTLSKLSESGTPTTFCVPLKRHIINARATA